MVDWRRKLGAHRRGVHPLLVEAADRIEELEEALRETFGDCYNLNEFGQACVGCKQRKQLLA